MQRRRIKGVFGRWLWSYAIVLLVPVAFMAAAYQQIRWVIEEEIHRANSALLMQLQQEIDNYIDFTYRLADIISLNGKVSALIRHQQQLGEQERMNIVETLSDFRAYNISKSYVDRFYIYFHTGDFIVSDTAYYQPNIFYQYYVNAEEIALDEWKRKLTGMYRSQFINKQLFSGKPGIMYAQTLPIYHNGSSLATLIMELNEEQLMQSIRTIQSFNEGRVFVLGENNQLLASSEHIADTADVQDILNLEFRELNGTVEVELNGEHVTVSYTSSARTNWKYVYVLPTRLYGEKLQYIRNVSIMILMIALAVGSAIALFLAKKNYHPLQRLVKHIAERSESGWKPPARESESTASRVDEFDYLEEMIDRTFEHNSAMTLTLEKQKKTLFSNLLVRMLKGRIEQSFPLDEVLSEYGVHLHSEKFAVMLFYLEDYSRIFRENQGDEEKNRKFVHLIVTNIVEELASQEHQGWMTEIDDMLACIINFKPGTEPEAALDDMKKIAENAKRFIGSRFEITFTVSVGAVHGSIAELPHAYQEALEAMEHRMLLGPFRTFVWEEQPNSKMMSYTYSLEKEKQLISHVNAGDFRLAKQTLDEIIDSNLAQNNISVNMIRCLMFDMCSTMMRAAMEVNLEDTTLHQDNMEAIQELINGSTVSALRERMTRFLQKVCDYVDERNKSNKVRLKEGVMAYIAESYGDPNMSVSSISDYFNVHPSYLSRYFKEKTGETLNDYISKYRVERSKELLLQHDILIKDVGAMVGICSTSSFIRVFKKYEGVTPSIYRERNREEIRKSGTGARR